MERLVLKDYIILNGGGVVIGRLPVPTDPMSGEHLAQMAAGVITGKSYPTLTVKRVGEKSIFVWWEITTACPQQGITFRMDYAQ